MLSTALATGYFTRLIKGIPYAFFPVTNGNYEVNLARDVTAPIVTGVSPRSGETGASSAANVMVAFSEALSAASINTNTLTLRDASNAVVPAAVSYIASTFTAVLTPNSPLAYAANYTATVKGGSGGVTDWATNHLASDFTWSFSTESAPPYRIGNTNDGSLTRLPLVRRRLDQRGAVSSGVQCDGDDDAGEGDGGPRQVQVRALYRQRRTAEPVARSTVEVTNPATGWQDFPLTAAVALTNGGYYWLAIWSDDEDARVYYSSASGGTLRWGQVRRLRLVAGSDQHQRWQWLSVLHLRVWGDWRLRLWPRTWWWGCWKTRPPI